jgi:hypothetical protein
VGCSHRGLVKSDNGAGSFYKHVVLLFALVIYADSLLDFQLTNRLVNGQED